MVVIWQGTTASNNKVGLLYSRSISSLFKLCGECTAFAISESRIMTAAHCVYTKDPSKSYSVTFGKVGRQHSGLAGNQKIKKCRYPTKFDPKDAHNFGYDYAVCLLSQAKPYEVGVYALSATNSISGSEPGAGVTASTTGYPLEAPWPALGQLNSVKRPFTATCELFEFHADATQDTSYMTCVTSGGQSGAPVVLGDNDDGPAVAILVGGPEPDAKTPGNTGTDVLLLNTTRVQNVRDWQNGDLKP